MATDLFLPRDPVALDLARSAARLEASRGDDGDNQNSPARIAGGVLLPRRGHGLDSELMNMVLDQRVGEGDAWTIHGMGVGRVGVKGVLINND